jgi:phosphoglycolate phosphatase-like HAD superfamily hydrolase
MKPGLLALDFDGVVCDGIDEMVESSWRTLGDVAAPEPELTDELRARFAALRPAIESGWEMVALLGLLAECDAGQDSGLREAAAWVAARDGYLKAHGLTQQALAIAFDAARLRWIEQDAASWLGRHRFYPGVADWLRRLQAERQLVYVISTKSKTFLDALLGAQKVDLPTERIIGRAEPRRDKWDVLRGLADQHGIAAGDVWFVEDRLATLLEMRHRAPDFTARLFFADWGYIFPDRDVAAARAAGIPVLSLEQATGPFEGWLRQ